jgi:BirA family biotin operon repressor/biotin-[acetyl-CoA-carboxylase] ligase
MHATDSSTTLAQTLFADLADGEFHSGEQLARARKVTRAGVWKAIEQLRELGLPLEATPNRGYRLSVPTEALLAMRILDELAPETRARIDELRAVWSIDSTNSALMHAAAGAPGRYTVLLAENQLAGRGRRGREWQAPLGGGLCMSLGFSVEGMSAAFGALTLAIGLAVREAVTDCGARGIRLKWPNDLLAGDSKVGGILTELRAEAGGPAWVVCGIGLNCSIAPDALQALRATGATPGDLLSAGLATGRNRLAARVVARVVQSVDCFLTQGFAPFADEWRDLDALHGQSVRVVSAAGELVGTAAGIDSSGALLLDTPAGRTAVVAGDVSVRRQ